MARFGDERKKKLKDEGYTDEEIAGMERTYTVRQFEKEDAEAEQAERTRKEEEERSKKKKDKNFVEVDL